MKVLQIHALRKFFGGTDRVVLNERALLKAHGHEVILFEKSTEEVFRYGLLQKARFFPNVIYHRRNLLELRLLIAETRPDVAHIHNIYPMISPAVYGVLRRAGVPSVQSFHDHRLPMLCAQGDSFRAGKACALCHGGNHLHGIAHRCFKGSLPLTAAYALAMTLERLGAWLPRHLTVGIVFNGYMKPKLLAAGFPENRIVEKPHFLQEEVGAPSYRQGDYAVYIGSLSRQKGVFTLLEAARALQGRLGLKLIGGGEEAGEVGRAVAAQGLAHVELLGFMEGPERLRILKDARFSIVPSESQETFGLTAMESLACGVPVIASRMGGFPYLVEDGKNGLLFAPGDSGDLRDRMEWLLAHPQECLAMGRAARASYELKYTPERNHRELLGAYAKARALFG